MCEKESGSEEMQRIMGANAAGVGDQQQQQQQSPNNNNNNNNNSNEAMNAFCYGIGGTIQSPVPDYAALYGMVPSNNLVAMPSRPQSGGTPTTLSIERQFELLAKCQQHTPPPPPSAFTATVMHGQTPPLTTNTVVTEPCNLSALIQHIYTAQKLQQQQQQQRQCFEDTMPKNAVAPFQIVTTDNNMPKRAPPFQIPFGCTMPKNEQMPMGSAAGNMTPKSAPPIDSSRMQKGRAAAQFQMPFDYPAPKSAPIQTVPPPGNTTPKGSGGPLIHLQTATAATVMPPSSSSSPAEHTTPKKAPIQIAEQTPITTTTAAGGERNSCTNIGTTTTTTSSSSSSAHFGPSAAAQMLMLASKKLKEEFTSSDKTPAQLSPTTAEMLQQQQFNNQQQEQMQLLMQHLMRLYGTKFEPNVRSAFTAVPVRERQKAQQVQHVPAPTAAEHHHQYNEDQPSKIASPQSFVIALMAKEEERKKRMAPLTTKPKQQQQQQQTDKKFRQYMPSVSAPLASPTASARAWATVRAATLGNDDSEQYTAAATTTTTAATAPADEYVDVVGDGAEGRSSQMRHQRKAHIDFYRKLKSLRSRGPTLECQQCGQLVANTDACTRSHLHAHCEVALFVCKLCQRGFADQHLVFDHINTEHPMKKGTQCIEDRRDMAQLMQLLTDCFPRVICKAKDAMHDHLVRLLSDLPQRAAARASVSPPSAASSSALLQCHLCKMDVPADRTTLHAHLSTHPAFRCKKCKFVSMSHVEQKVHQQAEHGMDEEVFTNSVQQPYCVSSALEVQFDTLRACFPLQQQPQQNHNMSATAPEDKTATNNDVHMTKAAQTTASRRRKTLQADLQTASACGKRKRNKGGTASADE